MRWTKIITMGDKLLIITIILTTILITVIMYGHTGDGTYAVIEVDGIMMEKLDLNEPATVSVMGVRGETVVEITDHEVRVISSSCPNKFCIKSGAIKNPGEMIICVPNHVVVRIDGRKTKTLDAITE